MRTLIAVLLLALAMPAFAGDTLDNKAVVEMVKLGLDQQIISAKIDASPNHFDTSPKALSRLKRVVRADQQDDPGVQHRARRQ